MLATSGPVAVAAALLAPSWTALVAPSTSSGPVAAVGLLVVATWALELALRGEAVAVVATGVVVVGRGSPALAPVVVVALAVLLLLLVSEVRRELALVVVVVGARAGRRGAVVVGDVLHAGRVDLHGPCASGGKTLASESDSERAKSDLDDDEAHVSPLHPTSSR